MRGRLSIVAVSLTVIVLDQITKALVVARIPNYARIPIVEGHLALTHVQNRGMAFGLFSGVELPWLRWVLVAIALVAVAVIWSYARHGSHQLAVAIAFGSILGGAVGNLIDRLHWGYVVDFVLAHWGTYQWPAFNVADAAITMGGVVLFLALAWESPENRDIDTAESPSDPPEGDGERGVSLNPR